MTVLRYKLPSTLAEAHLEIMSQARQADEAEQYLIDQPSAAAEENTRLWEQNRMLRAENRGLRLAMAEALKPPERRVSEAEARLHKLEDGLRKLLQP